MVNSGDYSTGTVVPTISPSMDIQVASNFERYLFYLFNEDSTKLKNALAEFSATGKMNFTATEMEQVEKDFSSSSVNREETLATIAEFKKSHDYLLDPHTAVGVKAAMDSNLGNSDFICLATAHPAKFGDAVKDATGEEPLLPQGLSGLDLLESRCEIMDADYAAIRAFVEAKAI